MGDGGKPDPIIGGQEVETYDEPPTVSEAGGFTLRGEEGEESYDPLRVLWDTKAPVDPGPEVVVEIEDRLPIPDPTSDPSEPLSRPLMRGIAVDEALRLGGETVADVVRDHERNSRAIGPVGGWFESNGGHPTNPRAFRRHVREWIAHHFQTADDQPPHPDHPAGGGD